MDLCIMGVKGLRLAHYDRRYGFAKLEVESDASAGQATFGISFHGLSPEDLGKLIIMFSDPETWDAEKFEKNPEAAA